MQSMDTTTVTHQINAAIACLRAQRSAAPVLDIADIDKAINGLQCARAEINGDYARLSVPQAAADAIWVYP